MPELIPSKRSSSSGRVLASALLTSCLALPALLLAVPGCGGDGDASHTNNTASGSTTGVAGGVVFVPVGDGKDSGKALIASRYEDQGATISPDGKWMAYISDESGRHEAYVQGFPVPAERSQVSTGGAGGLRWSRDGRQLFYATIDPSRIMSIPLTIAAGGSVTGMFVLLPRAFAELIKPLLAARFPLPPPSPRSGYGATSP